MGKRSVDIRSRPKKVRKISKIEVLNLIIAAIALLVSGLSFWFSYYSFKSSKEERVSIVATPLSDNYTTKVYSMGNLIVLPLFWEITLSNNSDKSISLIDIEIHSDEHDFYFYSNMFGGLYSNYDSPVEMPINLNSGESRKFAIKIGILCDSVASRIIKQNTPHQDLYDTVGTWTRRNVILRMLSEKGIDFYGNETKANFDGEKLLAYQVNPKKQQIFSVSFISSTKIAFSKSVSLYMMKE